MPAEAPLRRLVVVLGDQLDAESAAFDDFDPATDAVWMAEVEAESTHVWSHKARIALFLSAMRHFRERLRKRGYTVHYRELAEVPVAGEAATLAGALAVDLARLRPERAMVVEPGEFRVARELEAAAAAAGVPLAVWPDRQFRRLPDAQRTAIRTRAAEIRAAGGAPASPHPAAGGRRTGAGS